MIPMERYVFSGLLSVFLLLTIRDLFIRESPKPDDVYNFKKQIPETQFSNIIIGPAIRISYCYSCGYRRAFEDYSRVIKERYPQITVVGENHTPNFIRLAIAQTLSFGKFVVIGLIVSNINPFSYFGMITPTYWNMLAQHRLYGSMMIFFICNTLESYLMSTGAFEITYNGVLIWSKLKNGRMISPQELFSLISLEEDLTKGNILDYNPTS